MRGAPVFNRELFKLKNYLVMDGCMDWLIDWLIWLACCSRRWRRNLEELLLNLLILFFIYHYIIIIIFLSSLTKYCTPSAMAFVQLASTTKATRTTTTATNHSLLQNKSYNYNLASIKNSQRNNNNIYNVQSKRDWSTLALIQNNNKNTSRSQIVDFPKISHVGSLFQQTKRHYAMGKSFLSLVVWLDANRYVRIRLSIYNSNCYSWFIVNEWLDNRPRRIWRFWSRWRTSRTNVGESWCSSSRYLVHFSIFCYVRVFRLYGWMGWLTLVSPLYNCNYYCRWSLEEVRKRSYRIR